MAADVLLFCERKKWHGRSITRALKARGITPLTVSLSACGFSTATRTGLAIPELGDHLPRGALVLFVPGGSFEQVTLYLGVLHALRELGVRVWNDARAIERCVDKSTTTFVLQKAGIPTPRTWSGTSRDEAEAIVEAARREGRDPGAEAAVRRARRRLAPDRDRRRSRARRGGERGLLSARVHPAGGRRLSRLAHLRLGRAASSPP